MTGLINIRPIQTFSQLPGTRCLHFNIFKNTIGLKEKLSIKHEIHVIDNIFPAHAMGTPNLFEPMNMMSDTGNI